MIEINTTEQQGLEISLAHCLRLLSPNLGGDFWIAPSQDLIIRKFAPFLPRMTYDNKKNVVYASMFINGQEVLKNSWSIPSNQIALAQSSINKLQQCIDEFKHTAQSSGIDHDMQHAIENFRLPDPQLHPELFRFYGNPLNPKLAIIWGLEQVSCSSILVSNLNANSLLKSNNIVSLVYQLIAYFKLLSAKQKKIVFIGIGTVLLLVLIVVGIIYGSNGSNGSEAEPVAQAEKEAPYSLTASISDIREGIKYLKVSVVTTYPKDKFLFIKINGVDVTDLHEAVFPVMTDAFVAKGQARLKESSVLYNVTLTYKLKK